MNTSIQSRGVAADSDDGRWRGRLLRLLMLLVLCRAVYAVYFCQQLDLAGDEAYYWDWGRRPDWGYFSKPPMIGWLMGLVTMVSAGWTELGVRLTALLLGTVSLVLLHQLARQVVGSRAAFLTVLVALLTPANVALNLFLTIDAPLVLCWTAALLLFWKALRQPERLGVWLALGLVMGAGVLSKQMMLVFPVLMLITVVSRPDRGRLLRAPGLWVAVVLGVLALLPVLAWNARHAWITLEHTRHHFDAEVLGIAGRVERFALFPLLQMLIYTPVTWLLLMAVAVVMVRRWRTADLGERFLTVFSVLPLSAFFLLALRQEINPNWPAVYYIGLMVLLGRWLAGAGLAGGGKLGAGWRRWALGVGAVMTLAVYALPAVIQLAGWQGKSGVDVFADLRGWRQAGVQADVLLARCPHPDRTLVVVLGHRYNAAHMAFEMPSHPQVFRWERDGSVQSQYEVWPSPADRIGWDAMVIYPDSDDGLPRRDLMRSFWKHFAGREVMGDIDVEIGNGRRYRAQVFLCRDMKQWPPPVQDQETDPTKAVGTGGQP
ncbi:MAG: glycosyltransferase family 39 protein [Verrucomicrobiales bacterium]|nr:glycosyltransferase family 39 protein [Verrucomicrobiales bacterium]